jgi:hypothetical protein
MSIGAAVDAALASPAPERPPPSAACRAWRDHIADLLEQHRHAREIDDVTFANAMHLFYEADSACTLSRFR